MAEYKDAKAEAKATKARAKAMRPWFKKKRFILGGLLLLVVIGAAVGGGGNSSKDDTVDTSNDTPSGVKSDFSTNDEHPPAADVEIVSCKESYGTVNVALRVTNHSSKASDYTISVGVEDNAGTKIGDGFASTSNVNPGQVANVEGFATLTGDPSSFRCLIEEVERFAS